MINEAPWRATGYFSDARPSNVVPPHVRTMAQTPEFSRYTDRLAVFVAILHIDLNQRSLYRFDPRSLSLSTHRPVGHSRRLAFNFSAARRAGSWSRGLHLRLLAELTR